MPHNPIHRALARQWEILVRLPKRAPGITAQALTDYLNYKDFTVSKRTVERDLLELEKTFCLACNDESKPFGWYFSQSSPREIGAVDVAEALALRAAEDILRASLPDSMVKALESRFAQARDKLHTLDGHAYAKWTQKVRHLSTALPLHPPRIDRTLLETVQNALIEEHQITVRYTPAHDNPKDLTLHPLSLILKGAVPYLVATAFDYDAPRIFAIHRMRTVESTAAAARIPKDYSVDDFIAGGGMAFGSGKPITLKARLSNELATYLEETKIAPDQKIQYRNGYWQLTAKVRHTWELRFWILSQGSAITLTAPKALQEQIQAELKAAAGNYGVDRSDRSDQKTLF